MRRIIESLVMIMTVSFVVLAVAQAEPSTLLVAGLAAVTITALLSARYLAVLITSRVLRIGHRSRAHEAALAVKPAPQHPDTAGRPRSRAPAQSAAVA